MSAYVERVFVAPAEWNATRARYVERLASLGWRETFVDEDVSQFTRDADEFAQVQRLPLQDYWESFYETPGPILRLSLAIKPA
jgi:hypothetical protein